ncbi:MAG TPA: hypothetical protein VNZ59_05930 [Burkholderiales bacterium]|jgi:hypothetical protein|nr:hypothetical protein [Burkholderiales bacterium]
MNHPVRFGAALAATVAIGYALVGITIWAFGFGTVFGWLSARSRS